MNQILHKILSRTGQPDLLDILAEKLTPSELNTLLLEVMAHQVAKQKPADLLRRYQQNIMGQPSGVDVLDFKKLELLLLQTAVDQAFEPLELSPVSPLGACSTVATVHQHKVLSALRQMEVVADATNALALESSMRRKAAGFPKETLHLCTSHRHLRTQQFKGRGFTPHFQIFCLTSAGRDAGTGQFESENLLRHLEFYIGFLKAYPAEPPFFLRLIPVQDADEKVVRQLMAAIEKKYPELHIVSAPDVQYGDGGQYYRLLRFQLVLQWQGNELPVIDGGFTDWTQQLSSNKKERFLSSGLGLEFFWKIFSDRL